MQIKLLFWKISTARICRVIYFFTVTINCLCLNLKMYPKRIDYNKVSDKWIIKLKSKLKTSGSAIFSSQYKVIFNAAKTSNLSKMASLATYLIIQIVYHIIKTGKVMSPKWLICLSKLRHYFFGSTETLIRVTIKWSFIDGTESLTPDSSSRL